MIEGIEKEILRGILKALEQKFNLVGSVIEGEARKLIIDRNIRDKDDFLQNTGYEVVIDADAITLFVGSNVKHEQYVLGGREGDYKLKGPPVKVIKSWVERKNISWVDGKGKPIPVDTIVYLVIEKIKREGIEEKNVFAEIIKNKEKWIYDQLDSVLVN